MTDLQAIVDGTVKEAEAKLPALSDGELAELRKIEESGKNRSTMLDAIDDAMGGEDTVEDKQAEVDARFARADAKATPEEIQKASLSRSIRGW